MPRLDLGSRQVGFDLVGAGPAVFLIHSSVSGRRQWASLAQQLSLQLQVVSPDLLGYGETTAWTGDRPQTLLDQTEMIVALVAHIGEPLALVGHSFGATVAMKVACLLGRRLKGLVLIEPNPFHLLQQNGREEAFAEASTLRDVVKTYRARGQWEKVASRFADYWNGDGTWSGMSAGRRAAFVAAMPPNFHEWDAVMGEMTPLSGWGSISAETMIVRARDTKRPIREIVDLLLEARPEWRLVEVETGGHMAAIVRPDLVNPVVTRFVSSLLAG